MEEPMSYNLEDDEDGDNDDPAQIDLNMIGRNVQGMAQANGGEFLGSGHATNLDDMDHEQMLKVME